MSDTGTRIADAAAAMLGTKFRMHGRHPVLGLDCVGLVACALQQSGCIVEIPQGYRLRNSSIESLLAQAASSALAETQDKPLPGDIVLTIPGPAQHHLLVTETPRAFIHADAGLGRVVRTFAPLPWPIIKRWRAASFS